MILSDLTPDIVRDEVCGLVCDHLGLYVVPLMPLDCTPATGRALRAAREANDAALVATLEARAEDEGRLILPMVEQLRSTTLAHEAWALTHYALTGADGEAETASVAAAYARDRILSITTTLDGSAWDPRGQGGANDPVCGPVEGESWPTTHVGLACLAAWARIRLDEGAPLTQREIAALGGLGSANAVRMLLSRGELRKRTDGDVGVREARRWLSGRGVKGVDA